MGSIFSTHEAGSALAGVKYVHSFGNSDDYYERKMHDAYEDSCHEYYDEHEVDEYMDCMYPYELYDIPIIDKSAQPERRKIEQSSQDRRSVFVEPLHRVNMLNVTFIKPTRVL